MKDAQIWLSENYSDHTQVEKIIFPYNEKLTGELVIADFPKLEKIYISGSSIKIPYLAIINCPQIKEIKVSFVGLQKIETEYYLEKLEVLELCFNSLSFIPPQFFPLTLKEVNFSCNEITALPENISELVSLESFDCHGNHGLSGNFDITLFSKLTHINLKGTKISPFFASLEEWFLQDKSDLSLGKIIVRNLKNRIEKLESERKEELKFRPTWQRTFQSIWCFTGRKRSVI